MLMSVPPGPGPGAVATIDEQVTGNPGIMIGNLKASDSETQALPCLTESLAVRDAVGPTPSEPGSLSLCHSHGLPCRAASRAGKRENYYSGEHARDVVRSRGVVNTHEMLSRACSQQ